MAGSAGFSPDPVRVIIESVGRDLSRFPGLHPHIKPAEEEDVKHIIKSPPSPTPFHPCPIRKKPTPALAALINGPPPRPFPQLTRMILITIHLTFLVAGLTSMGSKGECLCLYRQGIPEDFIH